MKFKITFILTLFLTQMAMAQQPMQPCLYDLGIELMEQQYPGYQRAVEQTFESVKQMGSNRSDEVYTIPIVFHVVWNEAEENIPDEKIYEQLDELNRCYRRLNPDTVYLRDEFLPVAGDPHIEFEIAEIRRVQTSAIFEPTLFALPDNVKQTANGGSDAANPYHFLNVWICRIQPLNIIIAESPVLGYAYPPDSLSHWPAGSAAPSPELQGVVLDFRTIGMGEYEIQGVGTLPMVGRTAVHEIGHYLGLRHISGDGNPFGGLDCTASDGVDDTPDQGKQSEFNCDENQNTCFAGTAGDLHDMIENYMDYSNETCQNTFTKGQIAIMRGVLEGPRAGLLSGSSATEDHYTAAEVRVFPNPSNGLFQLQLVGKTAIKQYTVINTFGQVVIGQQALNGHEIDLSTLPVGIYWANFQIADGTTVSRKLVKG